MLVSGNQQIHLGQAQKLSRTVLQQKKGKTKHQHFLTSSRRKTHHYSFVVQSNSRLDHELNRMDGMVRPSGSYVRGDTRRHDQTSYRSIFSILHAKPTAHRHQHHSPRESTSSQTQTHSVQNVHSEKR